MGTSLSSMTDTKLHDVVPRELGEESGRRAHDIAVVASDGVIAKDAVHALQSRANVPDRVTVTVSRGLVTLEGTVDWMYQQAAAGSAMKDLNGVRSVANLIQVSQTPALTGFADVETAHLVHEFHRRG